MNLAADRGLMLLAFTAQPGTPSHDGLQLLASWAASTDGIAPSPIAAIEKTDSA
ncbi:hypothetical protein [Mycolicibacterium sarraceniae]|uniref:hypothetical protein n=1 Tax=Mycolicibacterium sarraceniae TaxID=1534348 RepID=UPI0013CFA4A4|nr:hypothetical protein [Mycolicibacterium sarraceniae]